MANEDNGVIQFTCEHCKISLTVDDSLAGVSGPCPSCGKPTKAPDQELKRGLNADVIEMQRRKEASRTEVDPISVGSRELRSDLPKTRSRKVVSETQREREEVAAVTKLLMIGLVVLVVVLVAAYFGYRAFNS